MKDVFISSDLALTLVGLLQSTIKYDTSGEPGDMHDAFYLEALLDLEDAINRS